MVRPFFIFAVRNLLLFFYIETGYCVALTNMDVDSVQIAFQ